MLGVPKRQSSFGADGRRVGGGNLTPVKKVCYRPAVASTTIPRCNKLLQPPPVAINFIQRAPIMNGLSIPAGLQKKFQRPMTKRRAYDKKADEALQQCSLGPKRRFGMSGIFSRSGLGMNYKPSDKEDNDGENGEEDESEMPFEPLQLWTSPHQGGELKGLLPWKVTEMQSDGYGNEETVTVIKPAPLEAYRKDHVFVPPVIAKKLRPHQREGVQFMYECVMGMRSFSGRGCILADDMGLGKTLQSVALVYTLLKTGIKANGQPTAKKVIIICPCSLVKNWQNEFVKWLGDTAVRMVAISEGDRKKVESSLDGFCNNKLSVILIASYECVRAHFKRLIRFQDCCDLLVCDEAHRLKNSDSQTSQALISLPARRRVLLTGTPMQNDLQEFFAMVDFTNPGVLGTQDEFRRNILLPILRGREPDATESQKRRMMEIQNDMSSTVNEFILRRINTLNAQHLPPKLVQVVCCNLTEIQQNMYQHILNSKDLQHVLDGKQVNCLGSIQTLMKLCNHPSLIVEEQAPVKAGRRATAKVVKYVDNDKETAGTPGVQGVSKFLPFDAGGGRRGDFAPVHPEWSGKMFVLYRLMKEMRKPGNGNDKIVIVSNYTQTLDLIGRMCRQNNWGFCRLDGSISMKKRQNMVDEFNDPCSPLIAFLLSSKAGGCGLNLIGGNRLVLFDPDWNPAVDKQAAARCWRDGQKKRCFTYRFLATGTVEEKIFQRQLSKEGLQSVVDDKEQVNALSTKDLRNLFKLRSGTPSDTHDKLRCERCRIIADNADLEASKALPAKLLACRALLDKLSSCEDAEFFLAPLVPQDYGVSKEEYEKLVKQPMDLGTIRSRLGLSSDHTTAYKSISGFSKDVNRIFSNVIKVWSPGDRIAVAARTLQGWWIEQWTELVPILMAMKANEGESSKTKTYVDDPTDALENCAHLNNDRRDDYQEQIGMPDEEDMRSWSHHYNTETVDDPIFRAALRGCDAVSFVFGLEVTWSLIQQRKEEEDERKAMLELECIKEEVSNNHENAADDEEAEFSSGEMVGADVTNDDDEDEAESGDDMGSFIVNDDEGDNVDNDEEEAELSMGENKDSSGNIDDDDEEVEFSLEENANIGVERIVTPTDEAASNGVENGDAITADFKVAHADSPPVSKRTSQRLLSPISEAKATPTVKAEKGDCSPSNQWTCSCTAPNNKSSRKCKTCGTKKPPTSGTKEPTQTDSGRKRKRGEVARLSA